MIATTGIKIFIMHQIGLSLLASSKALTLCIGFYAWVKWNHQEKVQRTQPTGIFNFTGNIVLLFFLILPLNIKYALVTNYNLELWATAINFSAYCLAAYRKNECWIFWIAYDCILISLLIEKQMYLNALTTLLYLPIALSGNHNWKKISGMAQRKV